MDVLYDVDLVRNVAKSILLITTILCLAGIPHIHRSLVAWKLRRQQRIAVAESLLVVGYIDMLQFLRRIGARRLPSMAIIYMFIQLFSMVQTYILLAAIGSQFILVRNHVDNHGAQVVADGYTGSNYSTKDDLFKSARKVDDTFLGWDEDYVPKHISFSPYFVVKRGDVDVLKLNECISVVDTFEIDNVRLMDINFAVVIEKLTPKLSSYWGAVPPAPTTTTTTTTRFARSKTASVEGFKPTNTDDPPMMAIPSNTDEPQMMPRSTNTDEPPNVSNFIASWQTDTNEATPTGDVIGNIGETPFIDIPTSTTSSTESTPTETIPKNFFKNSSNNACERSNSTVSNMIYIRTFSDYLTEMGLFSLESSFLPPEIKSDGNGTEEVRKAAVLVNTGCDTFGKLIDREFFAAFNQTYGFKEDYSYLLSSAGQLYQSLMYPDSPPDVIYPSSQAIQFLFSTLAFDMARSPIPVTVTLKVPGTHIQGWLLVMPIVFTLVGLIGLILALCNKRAQEFPVTALEWAMVACETKSHGLVTSRSGYLNHEAGLQSDSTAVVEMTQALPNKEFNPSRDSLGNSLDRRKDAAPSVTSSGRNSLEERSHTKRRHLKQMMWKTSENDFLELVQHQQ